VAERRVEDFSQWPVISGVLNTLMAQEGGHDHGDWVEIDRAMLSVLVPLNRGDLLQFSGGVESSRSLEIAASPSRGSWRPNPALGAGEVPFLRAEYRRPAQDPGRGMSGSLALETGSAGSAYLRMDLAAAGRFPLGAGTMHLDVQAGLGTAALPAYRSFVLGGRGSLPGEDFRAFGGRRAALARAEWRVPVNLPGPPGGRQAGRRAILAPFAAVGVVSGGYQGLPWEPSAGIRPVVGLASELLFQVFRIEAGYALRSGTFGLTIDASPSWWPIL
ncbi:MAG TPA: hypothetical protein VLL51_06450, partial [Gemmatimonadales bacterium]|nr:hypothetical protein [Gemmatimonadales bacterium]